MSLKKNVKGIKTSSYHQPLTPKYDTVFVNDFESL